MSKDASAFAACATHSSLGDEVANGQIGFDRWRLQFSSPQGALEIPLVRLQIELDPEEPDRVLFSGPDQPGWLIYTTDPQILDHPALRQQTHTRNQVRALRSSGELKRRLKVTCWFLAGFALVAIAVSLLLGVMVRSLVARVPPEWEQQLGDELMAELKEEFTIVRDAKLQAKLDEAVAPLLKALPQTKTAYAFYILQEPLPNAFAVPGGHVCVTTSLLELADRPEQIAGVVAHEIAHVTQKHGLRQIISDAGPYLIFSVFLRGGNGLMGVLGSGSQLLVRQSFSQEFEFEADAVGWRSLVEAKIDPRGLTEMLRKLEAEQRRLVQSGSQALPPAAFSSHPATEKRLRRLEAMWKSSSERVTRGGRS